MAKVEIYTTPFCGFCLRAKQYLKKQDIEFTEYDVSANPELRREMTERSQGGMTVPQIFINDQSIGGCDDLFELAMDGELEDLLV